MPELPEITTRARQMKAELTGKTITGIKVLQPKCLNIPPKKFIAGLTGARILNVIHRGKWIFVETTRGWLVLNLGMNGEILLVTRDTLPEKRRLVFDFDDGTCLSVNFWWFGYAHYVRPGELASHKMTTKLGPNALDVSARDLRDMLRGRRGHIKSFLLDQSRIAGIGNAYIHDILFLARLHPLRTIQTLSGAEVDALAKAIRDGLQPSVDKGGAFYEVDLYGHKGGFTIDNILVGYKEGKPCPVCGTPIEKIKTGSTSSFICPRCQPLAHRGPSALVPVYLDSSRPIPERVQDLLSHMALAEKISQMNHPAEAIPRLGIPAYNFWSEALHGVARNGRATVFPQAIGMAATWDRDLVQRVASAIGDEARAKHHEAVRRKGFSDRYQGLTFWSPNINIFRDPRWGRGQETWGEDPILTGEMGAAFVRGLQGDHPKYLKAAACAKHYAVHSGPEKDRHTFNAVVSRRDLYDTYLPAFKKLVTEAKVEAVMGAYNRTLDEPCCASQLLLLDILRGQWKFEGHVVSDCGALSDIHNHHKVTQDIVASAALALKKGCDIGCDCVYDHLGEAIQRGLITEADIDRALARTLTTRFKLGMFDPPSEVPYTSIPMSEVGCAGHRRLAYEAAVKSVVLLKNKGNILPMSDKVRSICVVGPNATSADILLGSYYGLSDSLTTLLEGIVGRVPEGVKVGYRPGSQLNHPNSNSLDWSVFEAASSDITIACMGLSPLMEGEEGDAIASAENGDRSDIALPAAQVEYIKRIVLQGAKVVLVLAGGSPIALGELEDMVHAIVIVWYPGQEGGNAVADVLFGKAAPSGKLPLTFPKSIAQLPPFDDYNMAGRTYRYSTAEPLYPFGFGLSYTHFAYGDLQLKSGSIRAGESLRISFVLANVGSVEADEVAQIYLSDLGASVPVPLHKLVGFQRVHLKPGESRTLEFIVTPEMMMLVDDNGESKLEPGQFRLTVGGCSPSARGVALGAPEPVSTVFTVAP